MLTEERKAIVDALTDEELSYEVNRGRESRFQKDLFDYARTRLGGRQHAQQERRADENLTVAKEARDATRLGAYVAIIAIIITVILFWLAKKWG